MLLFIALSIEVRGSCIWSLASSTPAKIPGVGMSRAQEEGEQKKDVNADSLVWMHSSYYSYQLMNFICFIWIYMNLNMWKPVSYSSFVQWCAEVLWAERKGLDNRELPVWSECKCSCNLKRAECFSRARVCHSATVFLRLPGARQWQHQLFLSSCWSKYAKPQMEGS